MALTDDERKELARLQEKQKEEEDALKVAEAEKKKAEDEKRLALKAGDSEKASQAQQTIVVSESTIHALMERLERTEALLIALAEERGVSKEKIEKIKAGRFGRVGR